MITRKKKTATKYDTAEFLFDEEEREMYLEAIAKFKDDDLMQSAILDVERSRLLIKHEAAI